MNDLQGFISDLTVYQKHPREIHLRDKKNGRAAIRLTLDGKAGHWLLTAYVKGGGASKGFPAALDSLMREPTRLLPAAPMFIIGFECPEVKETDASITKGSSAAFDGMSEPDSATPNNAGSPIIGFESTEVKGTDTVLDDVGHAIASLKTALNAVETNEPINRAEGNIAQADLEAEVAGSIREAVAILNDVEEKEQAMNAPTPAAALDDAIPPGAIMALPAAADIIAEKRAALREEKNPLERLRLMAQLLDLRKGNGPQETRRPTGYLYEYDP
ncbi:MAG: hypothetical protein LBS70_02645, partial [Candidatus Accumulibacter sp.]|nr:hypothetical protein [Accumulibacter sp.]